MKKPKLSKKERRAADLADRDPKKRKRGTAPKAAREQPRHHPRTANRLLTRKRRQCGGDRLCVTLWNRVQMDSGNVFEDSGGTRYKRDSLGSAFKRVGDVGSAPRFPTHTGTVEQARYEEMYR